MNKYINMALAVASASLVLTSCDDLDNTERKGGYVTTDQKEVTLLINPDRAEASVTGIGATATRCGAQFGEDTHNDFGFASIMLGTDLQGTDMVCDWVGYNWFLNWEGFRSPTVSGYPTYAAWGNCYDQIGVCNTVAQSIAPDTDDPNLQFYRAQAVGTRGFDYWVLAQLYQFNYSTHADSPCLPIVTDANAVDVEENGAPRSTVREVYDQILTDLTEAIELLEKSGKTPQEMMSSKAKRFMSVATAYGLRARAYLTMHKYAEAAADAQKAIDTFTGSPKSAAEASRPAFWSLDESDWMWGIAVNTSDRVVTSGIINLPSMLCTFCSSGYVGVGVWKYASSELYDLIPNSDVRKGWFLDENLVSNNLTRAEQAYIDSQDVPCVPYTNVKFAAYGGAGALDPSEYASDIVLMRIEEMYYILAEGKAMSGDVNGGKSTLESFEKNYRNPNYVCQAQSAEDLQKEIVNKRRIEFWGEGVSWFDIMRLDRPVNRWNSNNWPSQACFRIPSVAEGDANKAAVRIYCIPQSEITGNPAISASDNNLEADPPTPDWK